MRYWLLAAVAVGGLLIACGGSSSAPKSALKSTPKSTPSALDRELRGLAGKSSQQPAKIEYKLSGSDANGTLTFYWKSQKTWRLDYTLAGTTGRLLTTNGQTYVCDASGGAGVCQAVASGSRPLPLLTFFTDPKSFTHLIDTEIAGVAFTKSQRQIAGLPASCFAGAGTISGKQGSAEYCFSDNGLLLRLAGASGTSKLDLEATTVSSSVAGTDFDLPYPVLAATP